MRIRIRLATLVLSLLAVSSSAIAADTLESVEKKITEQWSKLKSLSAKTTMDMNMQGMSMKSEGTIEYMTRDGKELFRMDMTMKQSMGGQEMDGSMYTIADGQFVYAVTEMMGQKMAMKQKPDAFQGAVGGKQMFEDMRKNNELKLLPDEKVDGQGTFVIEAKPKPTGPKPYSHSKMFFAKDTGIMVKMVGVGADGQEVMTMKVSDVKRDAKIDADRFVFKAPDGVQVMDMTAR